MTIGVHTKQTGNKHSVIVVCLLLLSYFSTFTSLEAKEPVSVGVVNVTFLMENAPQAGLASAQLKEKFLPQEKKLADDLEEINKLSSALDKVTDTDTDKEVIRLKERELRSKKRARSRLLQDFREELRFARDAALDDVQKEVFSAIDSVRSENNIDIILQDYISASKRVDITPLVLAFLKKKLKNPAEKPQVTDDN